MLLDHNGQPFDSAALRSAVAQQADEPQSATVAQIWTEHEAHPARGLTPAKLRALLLNGERGDLATQVDLATDMEEMDAHLGSEVAKRRSAVSQLDWSVEPPENATAAEQALAAEVQEWLTHALDMPELIEDMLDGLLKGFSCTELVWRLQEKVLLPQATHRPARWFTVDGTYDNLLLRNPAADPTEAHAGLPQAAHLPMPTYRGEPLRPLAWLVHRPKVRSGYLSRAGLFRPLAFPYLYKAYAFRDFAEFLEIYGLPLRIGKYPTGATPAEKNALLRAVTSLGHNAAGIIPMGMALEFQNAAQGQRDPFLAMLQYCDAAESKCILGQTLSASEGQHGTQALGNVHEGVRMGIRNADARQVERSITEQLIRPALALNKGNLDPRRLPRLVLDTGEAEDLKLYADSLPKLAAAGVQIPVDWVADKLRIPDPEPGEVLMSVQQAVAAAQPGAQPGDPAATPGAPKPTPAPAPGKAEALAGNLPQSDLVDELAAELAGQWQPVLGPLVQPLLAELDRAIAAGETLAQLRARLPALAEQLDTGALTTQVSRAAFSARLAGEAGQQL